MGKRLYDTVFGSREADRIVQDWLKHTEQRTQHPVSLVRRLSQSERPPDSTPFEPPLRVLLVTARPDNAGFIDPRGIARELLDEVQDQMENGTIAVEFLRPHEEGQPVTLRDWWLPHFYQQRPLVLHSTKPARKRTSKQPNQAPLARLSPSMPKEPRYRFSGRARELLAVERFLGRGKLVVISGFGGLGKTTLAREAADWLTRTGMYAGACFVSFEQGHDTAWLLSELGRYLNVYDSTYNPTDEAATLARLKSILKVRRILLIADNLESILPRGEAPLESAARTLLWDTLLDLAQLGAGVLLTSRDTAFGDARLAPGSKAAHLPLSGLYPDDAFTLATRLLTDLGLDRRRTPYAELRDLLRSLDHHPLAIQLVLPTLRQASLARISTAFASLLPQFEDDTATGRHRSLLASLGTPCNGSAKSTAPCSLAWLSSRVV